MTMGSHIRMSCLFFTKKIWVKEIVFCDLSEIPKWNATWFAQFLEDTTLVTTDGYIEASKLCDWQIIHSASCLVLGASYQRVTKYLISFISWCISLLQTKTYNIHSRLDEAFCLVQLARLELNLHMYLNKSMSTLYGVQVRHVLENLGSKCAKRRKNPVT